MVKFIIFFGNQSGIRADGRFNEWIRRRPNVRVLSYQYQATNVGHSICVMYEGDSNPVYDDYDDHDCSGLLEED